jgi:hypothetical protein
MEMLKEYDVKLMLESWVELGQTKRPSGRSVDSDKAKATEILKCKGFCTRERVCIYALDVGCVFHEPAGKESAS